MDAQYERHLPHQVPEGFPIFVTWNLKGAIRAEMAETLRRKRERLEQEPRRVGESDSERRIRHDKLLFAVANRFLDHATSGPMQLKDPHAAKIVWSLPATRRLALVLRPLSEVLARRAGFPA
jgi:hypothetical protein